MEQQKITVSEFVALVNQSLEYAYPMVQVEGEVAEFRISKNRWVYFNLIDEHSSVRMFGTVYQLKHPIEDGMKVIIKGSPRLHNKYGFSINISSINPSGEGSIKLAFELLRKKLVAEGLFLESRKRSIPAIPERIGLITSSQAAAYGDFMKIVNQRWAGLQIDLYDVQVQGEAAPAQIVRAIQYFSEISNSPDVVVITRGGGSSEDLMAFSDESVVRAVAASRVPVVVGVGHEVDISLADLAADIRATTPTNAAQIITPDKAAFVMDIDRKIDMMSETLTREAQLKIDSTFKEIDNIFSRKVEQLASSISLYSKNLSLVNPVSVLSRGYSLAIDSGGAVVKDSKRIKPGDNIKLRFSVGEADVEVKDVR